MNDIQAIRRIFGREPVSICGEPLLNDSGVTNRIAAVNGGIRRYAVEFPDGDVKRFIGKRKSAVIIAKGVFLLGGNDPLLTVLLALEHKILGYNASYVREAALYGRLDASLRGLVPEVLGSAAGRFSRDCFIAMEQLPEECFAQERLYAVIDSVARFHAHYFGDISCVEQLGLNCYRTADYRRIRPALHRMFDRLSQENLSLFGEEKVAAIHAFIERIHTHHAGVEHRRTLTHNDFSLRNIYADGQRICIYDWELACYQNPEHDMIELLISVMTEMTDSDVAAALEHYRRTLSQLTGETLSEEEYAAALRFNTMELCVNKLTILRLAGRRLKLDYTEALARNTSRMMDILKIS